MHRVKDTDRGRDDTRRRSILFGVAAGWFYRARVDIATGCLGYTAIEAAKTDDHVTTR